MKWRYSQSTFPDGVNKDYPVLCSDTGGLFAYVPDDDVMPKAYIISEQFGMRLVVDEYTLYKQRGDVHGNPWYASDVTNAIIYWTPTYGWVLHTAQRMFPGYIPVEYEEQQYLHGVPTDKIWKGDVFYACEVLPNPTIDDDSVVFVGRGTNKNSEQVPNKNVYCIFPRYEKSGDAPLNPIGEYTGVDVFGEKSIGVPRWTCSGGGFDTLFGDVYFDGYDPLERYRFVSYDAGGNPTFDSVMDITYDGGKWYIGERQWWVLGWWEGPKPSITEPTVYVWHPPNQYNPPEVPLPNITLTFSDYIIGDMREVTYLMDNGVYRQPQQTSIVPVEEQ